MIRWATCSRFWISISALESLAISAGAGDCNRCNGRGRRILGHIEKFAGKQCARTGCPMKPQLLFYIGKGGVGKSTTSAITAVYLARHEGDVLLVSMDPAHNQRDIFQRDFSETPCRVSDHLAVKEVNVDYWIEKCLKETQKTIKQTYSYQSAFNLQNYFNVLQFSPGLEEYALLVAFENIIHRFKDKDVIIFDMAPTALTLRFFSLPFITLIWLEELLKLRKKIYAKKEIISEIKIGRKEIQQDKVKAKLAVLIRSHETLGDRFKADATRINLVLNQLIFLPDFCVEYICFGHPEDISFNFHT
jgi:arsenite-transporting ATPase